MGSKHAHTLIPALKKRGLDAMGMAAMLQRDHPAAASRVHDVPADMLILVMGLSDKKEADRHAVAEAVQKLAPLALFVDWRRA